MYYFFKTLFPNIPQVSPPAWKNLPGIFSALPITINAIVFKEASEPENSQKHISLNLPGSLTVSAPLSYKP